jgi:hypothetical protein
MRPTKYEALKQAIVDVLDLDEETYQEIEQRAEEIRSR